MPYRHPQRHRRDDGLTQRQIEFEEDCVFVRAVQNAAFVHFFGNAFEEVLHDDHVIHGIDPGNDIHPKTVVKPNGVDDQEIGNETAAEKHRKQIEVVDEFSERQVCPTHTVTDRRGKQYRRQRADDGSCDRDEKAHPKPRIVEDDYVVCMRRHAGQKPHATLHVIEPLVERTDQNVPHGIQANEGKDDQKSIVYVIEGLHCLDMFFHQ